METNTPKTVFVTGGAQGIGKGIAQYFLEKGIQVVIADVDDEAGEETLLELERIGAIQFVHMDVSDETSVQHAIEETISSFGAVDILVNNAGIANPHEGPVTELPLQEWNRVLAVNLTGMFLCAKHAAQFLKKSKGSIINIASTRAFMSEPDTEAYAASKGGIVALTHSLAVSLGPEIRVNCISPGWIEVSGLKKRTNRQKINLREEDRSQHPVGRVGRAEDIASLAYYLSSPDSGFITGANFMVDGGMTRKMIYV